jgi:cytochrome c2
MKLSSHALLLIAIGASPALAQSAEAGSAAWEASAHGKMLRRVVPPGPEPHELPEAGSPGARLLEQYCTQCHYLVSPAMHTPESWPRVVERMVRRMKGEGKLGAQMKELMQGVQAPSEKEIETLISYLKENAQTPIDASRYPDLSSPEGRAFSNACSQCHALPDPERHTAAEWPKIVERMQKHLSWAGTVRSSRRHLGPQLELSEIVEFLQRNSRQY